MAEGAKRTGIFVFIVGAVFICALAFAPLVIDIPGILTRLATQPETLRTISVNGSPMRVFVAETPMELERGLGGRDSLSPADGMLFVFPEDGVYGIWMKNMRFSIDIVWLSAEGQVVHIEERVSPETYPQAFRNTELARFVLELPAGGAEAHGIRPGSILSL